MLSCTLPHTHNARPLQRGSRRLRAGRLGLKERRHARALQITRRAVLGSLEPSVRRVVGRATERSSRGVAAERGVLLIDGREDRGVLMVRGVTDGVPDS